MEFSTLKRGSFLSVSFEYFPPRTEAAVASLQTAVRILAGFSPRFVSVTYGAGGSTRDRTHAIVKWLQNELGLPAAAHLTCVNASREDIHQIACNYWESGIRHIVALRGDPPGSGPILEQASGYRDSVELTRGLKEIAAFEISVAAYPEMHPQARSAAADIDFLLQKFEAGAERAITQFFFDPTVFLKFRDRATQAGIVRPIVPGILPIGNFQKMLGFAKACGTSVPALIVSRFDALEGNKRDQDEFAVEYAVKQCERLLSEGVDWLHFYTLNNTELTGDILRGLGVKEQTPEVANAVA